MGRGRPTPSPHSILDRQALLEALDARDIAVKPEHIDGFYQALHRQHYPSLAEFVEQYYQNERAIQQKGKEEQSPTAAAAEEAAPLKNPITNRKNKNRKNLPKPFLEFLVDPNINFVTMTSKVAKVMTSGDGSTTKLAVELHDGQLVESVLMRYGPKEEGKVVMKSGRASLCVSSQVGCAMACSFCATGMMGLTGNLSYTEILEQMIHANRILAKEALERRALQEQQNARVEQDNNNSNNNNKDQQSAHKRRKKKNKENSDLDVVRNVVFMGMGEPLDNYTNVVEACRALIDRRRWNLAHGRVTVSTVGIASKIRQLTKELPEVSLALSLHAPNQELRSKIVPTAKNYPLEDMVDALDGHMKAYLYERPSDPNTKHRSEMVREKDSSRRRAMIEYVMLEGETSSFKCAHELGKLCENKSLVVNLIPYNQTDVKDKLRCPSEEHIQEFRRILFSYGVFTTIRRTMGADIASACGQLVVKEEEKKKKLRDIEDGIGGSTSNNNYMPSSKTKKVVSAKMGAGGVRNQQSQSLPTDSNAISNSNNKQNKPSNNDGRVDDGKEIQDLERWVMPLQIATAIAASCFVVTTSLYMKQRKP